MPTCNAMPASLRMTVGALLLLLGSWAQAADFVVVVGAKSAAGNLTREQTAEIFLGRIRSFPGDGSAEPLDQAEFNDIRDEFYTKVTGKSAAQAKAYWAKMAFTGKGTPPREGANTADIKKMLADNPRAVGYIEKSAVDGSVKVVFSAQ